MNAADLQAVADLNTERLGIAPITVKLKNVRRGRANGGRGVNRWLSIPMWALAWGEHFAIYYVCHEVAHFKHSSHDSPFKRVERQLLKVWGMTIKYARAYPKALYAGDTEVYRRP